MSSRGTALVRVKAIDPYQYQRSLWLAQKTSRPLFATTHTNKRTIQAVNNMQSQPVYLQVATFRNKTNAERLKRRLISLLTMPVNIANASSKKHYQVQIGPIKDSATIAKITTRLKHFGINVTTSHQIVPTWDALRKNDF